jgi:hypothetical protein
MILFWRVIVRWSLKFTHYGNRQGLRCNFAH